MIYQSPAKAASSIRGVGPADRTTMMQSPYSTKSKSSLEGKVSPRAAALERSALEGQFSELVELAEDDEAGGAILKKLYCIHTRFTIEIDDDIIVDSEEIRRERELLGLDRGLDEEEKVHGKKHPFEDSPLMRNGGAAEGGEY